MSHERRLNTINSTNIIGSTLNEEFNNMLKNQKQRNVSTKLVKIKEQLKQSLQNLVQPQRQQVLKSQQNFQLYTQDLKQHSKSFDGKQKPQTTEYSMIQQKTEQKQHLQKSFIDLRQHINQIEISTVDTTYEDKLLLEKLKTLTMEQQEQNLSLREENAFLKIQLTKALQENQQLYNLIEQQKTDKYSKSQQTLYEKILEQSNMNKLPHKVSNHKINQNNVFQRQDKRFIKSENYY